MWLVQVHSWVNPIVFGNNRPNRTTDMGENVSPKPVSSGLSQTVWCFLGKNLKAVLGIPFPPKKVVLIFVIGRHVPSKIVMLPKNNFSLLFWKILFYSKKLWNEKYSKRLCLQGRLYWLLLPDAPLPSKLSGPSTNRVFTVFSPKKYCFFKKLVS